MYDNTNKHPILNSYGWFILIINLAFSIVNIVAVCVNFPRYKNLGFDYLGIIVGVLSILVTVLIGWQIFINISMEKKINLKLRDVSRSLRNEINDSVSKMSIESEDKRRASIVMSLYQSSSSAYNLQKYDFALWLALDSILNYNMIKNKDAAFNNEEYNNIIETLNMCIQLVPTINFLNREQIQKYLEAAKDLKLLDVAFHLKYKSLASDSKSSNYITNLISDKLPERSELNSLGNNGTENFIS